MSNENSYYWNDIKYSYNILFISHTNKLPLLSYIKREMKFCIFYEKRPSSSCKNYMMNILNFFLCFYFCICCNVPEFNAIIGSYKKYFSVNSIMHENVKKMLPIKAKLHFVGRIYYYYGNTQRSILDEK